MLLNSGAVIPVLQAGNGVIDNKASHFAAEMARSTSRNSKYAPPSTTSATGRIRPVLYFLGNSSSQEKRGEINSTSLTST